MKVLVACEFSGIVRDAFLARGHDAVSCDLLPSEAPGPHFQGDVLSILGNGWDAMIAHPPCTYLSSSGLHWNKRGGVPGRAEETEKALHFVRALLAAPIPRKALENPIGRIGTAIRPADQKIQPWMFGEDASKGTCLWLENLPKLVHGRIIPPRGWKLAKSAITMPTCDDCGEEAFCEDCEMHFADWEDGAAYKTIDGYRFGTRWMDPPPHPVWANQTPSGQNKLGPSATRWMDRSRTYHSIASAMAEQWGKIE